MYRIAMLFTLRRPRAYVTFTSFYFLVSRMLLVNGLFIYNWGRRVSGGWRVVKYVKYGIAFRFFRCIGYTSTNWFPMAVFSVRQRSKVVCLFENESWKDEWRSLLLQLRRVVIRDRTHITSRFSLNFSTFLLCNMRKIPKGLFIKNVTSVFI